MKEWKQVIIRIVQLAWILMLLNVPCWFCGYKHIFHLILPAKIQGLYGIKLDKPFIDESAVREGDHYNVSCEGKPCKVLKCVW
jgi:hypothetical protein